MDFWFKFLNIFILFLCLFSVSCVKKTAPSRIIKLNKMEEIIWSEQELQKDIAVKLLESNEHSSILLIRLKGSEKPHIHEHHDLSVYVLKGTSSVTIGKKEIELRIGDFVTIPKGTIHWAKNKGALPAEVVAIFSPPYKGRDIKFVD